MFNRRVDAMTLFYKFYIGLALLSCCFLFMIWSIDEIVQSNLNIAKINEVLDHQRSLIAEELIDYQNPNANAIDNRRHSLDSNSPNKIVIVSSWRSGSSFFGAVINSHPASFYHYEPLWEFDAVKIRSEPMAGHALHSLRSLFDCNFSDMGSYLKFHRIVNQIYENPRLWEQCKLNSGLCRKAEFLSPFCKLFPFQTMKVTRMQLRLMEPFLEDSTLNVQIVYLVRDPRGTLQSRKHLQWCAPFPDCIDIELHCADLEDDYDVAGLFSRKYPNTFRVLRYEDLSLNPLLTVQNLFEAFGLHVQDSVKQFLDTHTKTQDDKPYSYFRDSKSTPFRWREAMPHEEVKDIQRKCRRALENWGYVEALNKTHQEYLNPLRDFKLQKSTK